MDTCTYLDIFPGAIERASDILEAVCDKYGANSEAVWMNVRTYFDGPFASDHQPDDYSNFTDALINLMFNCLRDGLLDVGVGDDRIEWVCNGSCSDFYVDGEQVY